ncbi:MAG: YggS family pyridoxal phosphate enzyme, partial [Acidobacteria bacterium]
MVTPDELRDRLEQIHERIARAAQRAGRRPTEITLLGASKQVDPEGILLAIECGLRHIG